MRKRDSDAFEKHSDDFIEFFLDFETKNRYILSPNGSKIIRFINQLVATKLNAIIPKNTRLFRARINDKDNSTAPFLKDQMSIPPRDKTNGGRINPEGIPYLYCAFDEKTAISEVRPWLRSKVTVAKASTNTDLKIVDLTRDESNTPRRIFGIKEFSYESTLNLFFRIPRGPNDKLSYIPTQYIAENFKVNGFDGIKYSSGLSLNGFNLVVFDHKKVNIEETQLRQVIAVNYDYQ